MNLDPRASPDELALAEIRVLFAGNSKHAPPPPPQGRPCLSSLPDLSLPVQHADTVHACVWEVARLFGFQTFNAAAADPAGGGTGVGTSPRQQQPLWTPATAFVAGDHLVHLLQNGMLRLMQAAETAADGSGSDAGAGQPGPASFHLQAPPDDDALFSQSVYELHDNIFHSYQAWSALVGLRPLPQALLEHRQRLPAASPAATHLLLCELALYFLIWTEGANTRHLPEFLSFLYWVCSHTIAFVELCTDGGSSTVAPAGPRHAPGASLRDWRVHCRNAHQDVIAGAQRAAGLSARQLLPAAVFPADVDGRREQMPGTVVAAASIAEYTASFQASVPSPDVPLVTELALSGDGGFWMSHIVTPIFLLLAQEMEVMSGDDHCHRLGYDDVNESFCSKAVVTAALGLLGVTQAQLNSGAPHAALSGIATWVGSVRAQAAAGSGEYADAGMRQRFLHEAVAGVDGWFVAERAAAFWSTQVARKTFQERRTWWAVFRAYHRVFQINLVAFHIMMAQSLTQSWAWLPISSAVLTHAFLNAAERFANWLITRRTTSDTQRRDARRFGIVLGSAGGKAHSQQVSKGGNGDVESPSDKAGPLTDFRALRLLRRAYLPEGAPVWGIFGFLEWVLCFLGMLVFYILLWAVPPDGAYRHVGGGTVSVEQLRSAWGWLALAYTLVAALHFVLTTRPGYCISLSQALRLPAIFRASSARPKAANWLAGSLGVDFQSWLLQVVTWSSIWAGKWAFEYFAVSRPLAAEIHDLLGFNNCAMVVDQSGSCLNLSWVLVIVTMVPFVCLVLLDGMIAYHLYLTLTCLTCWLLRLNYATLPEWNECVREFYRAPGRWWARCTSPWGRRAAAEATARRYLPTFANMAKAEQQQHLQGTGAASNGGSDDGSDGADRRSSAAGSAIPLRLRTLQRAVNQGVAVDLLKTAQFEAFSGAWDALVADLREGDLLTDAEAKNCTHTRLHHQGDGWVEWAEAARCVGPIVMPPFFFAGQVQHVVDSGRLNGVQGAVLEQMRSLALLLAVDLGLLSGPQASAVQAARFVAKPTNLDHLEARAKTLPAAVKMVQSLQGVAQGKTTPRQGAKAFADALRLVMEGLEVECRAAGGLSMEDSWKADLENLDRATQGSARALAVLLELQEAAKHTDALSLCLEGLVPPPAAGAALPPTSSPGPVISPRGPGGGKLARQLVDVLHAMLTTTAAATCPSSSEARRIISSFLNSLSLHSLALAPALLESRSLTVVTPLYHEDVMYCLEAEESARKLGLGGADPASAVHGMTDLLTPPGASAWDRQGSVSLMAYLRSVYPSEWDNFRERIARLAKAFAAAPAADDGGRAERLRALLRGGWQGIRQEDFKHGGPLAQWGLELQLWASYRAQVLARTARGMTCCERALRVLGEIEHPRPEGVAPEQHRAWLRSLSRAKFTYLVAAQAYGRQRASGDLRERWSAHCLEVLLSQYDSLRVAYLDAGSKTSGGASVMIRGRGGEGPGAAAGAVAAATGPEEVYRVRLPLNPYNPGRGIVVGEGKPENQNHALIFAFGEAVETIDMNQDGCLAEALKWRNLVAELSPVAATVRPPRGGRRAVATAAADPAPPTAGEQLAALRAGRLSAPPPSVIVGFKEYIFSHKAGALANFAASTEYAFATVIQSDMARGNVRLHYGHPDVFDKLHIMTRGGLSKATRGLHVSEDVLGGLNHTLRGGRIKYTDAVSCGKGRDMGFNSILAFETKISCGNGEVMLTRDMARLAPRMDIWRLLHFYHSGLGYFVTARLLMLGIYCQALSMAVVALAGYGLVNSNIQLLIQIGLVSSLPYLAQSVFETGVFNASINFFRQIIAGVVAFSIFRMQTTAHYFSADVLYGGATYLPTGRGFSYRPSSFVQLYSGYGRTHLHLGLELMLLAVVVAASGSAGNQYGALMWGIWLVAASLVAAPFWFNPLSFNSTQVQLDWCAWQRWLQGDADGEVGAWATWNRRQLQRVRDDAGRQESHTLAVAVGVLLTALPHLILAFVAANRLTASTSGYLLLTLTMWVAVAALVWLRGQLLERARFVNWARVQSAMGLMAIALPVAFIVVVTRIYHDGDHFFLTLYVNLEVLLALHAAATQLFSGLSSAGELVDWGFWVLDCVSGTLLLSVVAILSLGGLLEKVQTTLLFNRAFAKSVKDSKTARLFAQLRPDNSGDGKGAGATQEPKALVSAQMKAAAASAAAAGKLQQRPSVGHNASLGGPQAAAAAGAGGGAGAHNTSIRQSAKHLFATGTMKLGQFIRGGGGGGGGAGGAFDRPSAAGTLSPQPTAAAPLPPLHSSRRAADAGGGPEEPAMDVEAGSPTQAAGGRRWQAQPRPASDRAQLAGEGAGELTALPLPAPRWGQQ